MNLRESGEDKRGVKRGRGGGNDVSRVLTHKILKINF